MNRITVTNRATNEQFPNLAGVFARVFPDAVGIVRQSGKPLHVTYYGVMYLIERK